MKTREIEVYVHPDDINDRGYFYTYGRQFEGEFKNGTLKAKLIIEIPERVATITESKFDEIFIAGICANNFAEAKNRLKRELFTE